MRRSTIVVAFLAATVASAEASPNTKLNQSGISAQTTSSVRATTYNSTRQGAVQSGAAVKPRAWGAGAAAFTSARAAAASARPATPVPAAAPPAARRTPSTRSRSASVARWSGRSRTVALTREIPSRRIARPAETASVAAPSGSIQSMVTAEAQRAGVSPALAHAVVKVESMYNPRATGKGGYVGLMQLSYQTAKGMGYRGSRAGLYEPSTNLRYGMRYLAEANRKAGGSTCGAVSKYQGGHGVRGVTRAGAVYCGKVRRFMASR